MDKVRYAKFQCARILKAIKAGEDPNGPNEEENVEKMDEGEEVIPVVPYVSPQRTSQASAPAVTPPPITTSMDQSLASQSFGYNSMSPPVPPNYYSRDTETSGSSPLIPPRDISPPLQRPGPTFPPPTQAPSSSSFSQPTPHPQY